MFIKVGAIARRALRPKATLALTATASPAVARDVCQALGLDGRDWEAGGDVRAASWRRPNLELMVRPVNGDGDKIVRLAALLGAKDDAGDVAVRGEAQAPKRKKKRAPGAAVVYTRTQWEAESVAERLRERGVEARASSLAKRARPAGRGERHTFP